MQIEGETLLEIGVSVVAVVLFVAAVMAVSASHGGAQLTSSGATLVVGTVVGFIFLMTAVGVFLDRR
ncbi:DUF7472 family protein [Halorarius halobius]|uniref:DUF7472 family protein n=1 Tax=Halorarius halobius TaxID=2962671 RepID=UPI0020CD5BF2|nr:hypothetical protein [Halorarius halobius]